METCRRIYWPAINLIGPVAPEKFANIAKALGKDITGLTSEEGAKAAIDAIKELSEKVSIPVLSETKFNPEDVSKLAEQAMLDVCTGGNPRTVTKEDIMEIYMTAYKG